MPQLENDSFEVTAEEGSLLQRFESWSLDEAARRERHWKMLQNAPVKARRPPAKRSRDAESFNDVPRALFCADGEEERHSNSAVVSRNENKPLFPSW